LGLTAVKENEERDPKTNAGRAVLAALPGLLSGDHKTGSTGKIKTCISWNVNGLSMRYAENQLMPVFQHNPEIICIQETKTPEEKIPEKLRNLYGYQMFCPPVAPGNFAETLLFTRTPPVSVRYAFGVPVLDAEGRVIIADFESFVIMNIYFPLGIPPVDTLEHKLAFYDAFLAEAGKLNDEGRRVIVCGDFSIAHTDNDIESVKKHAVRQVGTTPAEREKIDSLIVKGFYDTFRIFCKEKGHYTWWPNGFRIRDRHLGKRLDYFFVNEPMKPLIVNAGILPGFEGSDHCPVMLEVNL
jgi:exodeoxyribonuclease-3